MKKSKYKKSDNGRKFPDALLLTRQRIMMQPATTFMCLSCIPISNNQLELFKVSYLTLSCPVLKRMQPKSDGPEIDILSISNVQT